jgi:hypothetical protein
MRKVTKNEEKPAPLSNCDTGMQGIDPIPGETPEEELRIPRHGYSALPTEITGDKS